MTKAKLDKGIVTAIRNAVKNLKKDESVDFQTDFSARRLTSRLCNIDDDEGNHMLYRCQSIPGGVRVICTSRFKITNARRFDVRENTTGTKSDTVSENSELINGANTSEGGSVERLTPSAIIVATTASNKGTNESSIPE
jgi:hypothetical protein